MTQGRTERGHRYAYVGPDPDGAWGRPDTVERLRALSTILLELHDAAGCPAAYRVARRVGTSATTVAYLLTGRRLPTWELTSWIAAHLARAAGRSWPPLERRLHDAYVQTYDRGDRS